MSTKVNSPHKPNQAFMTAINSSDPLTPTQLVKPIDPTQTAQHEDSNAHNLSSHDYQLVDEHKLNEVQKRAQVTFQKVVPCAPEVSGKFFEQVVGSHSKNQCNEYPASELFPTVIVEPNGIHVLGEKIGEGTFSVVHKDTFIPTHKTANQSPSKPTEQALKRAKNNTSTYENERLLLQKAISPLKGGVDRPQKTFVSDLGTPFAVHKLYDGSFSSINYLKLKTPVIYMIQTLFWSLTALESMHRHGFVHRDLKGANMLVRNEGSTESIGALTDFGTLQKQSSAVHRTLLTPPFVDPLMFSPNNPVGSLLNQFHRKGIQTREGDVYAFGLMIEINGLNRLFKQWAQSYDLTSKVDAIMQKAVGRKLDMDHTSAEKTEQMFNDLDNKYPYRTVHLGMRNVNNKKKHYIFIQAEQKDRIDAFNNAIDFFEKNNVCSATQAWLLKNIVIVCFQMQQIPLENRITAKEALEAFEQMVLQANLYEMQQQELSEMDDLMRGGVETKKRKHEVFSLDNYK